MSPLRWIALALLAVAAGQARAQTQSVSYSTWVISENLVTLRFLLPHSEAQRLMGRDVPVATVAKVGEYLLRQVSVHSVSGECSALDQGYDLGRVDPLAVGPDMYGFEIFYRCADPRQLVLQDAAVFARVPQHINIARLYRDGRAVEHVFTATTQRWALPDVPEAQGFVSYLSLGARHILLSADRLCLILGLVLLIRRRRDAAYLVFALMLGYGLSLLVSRGEWLWPRATLVNAFVGLIVALVGWGVVIARVEKHFAIITGWTALLLLAAVVMALVPRPEAALILLGGAALSAGLLALADRPTSGAVVAPLLAGLLGFVDGFLWAGVVEPAQLTQAAESRMLFGLDVGSVLIEIAVAGALVGAFRLVRAVRFEIPGPLLNDVCAAALAGCGTFWLVTRLV